MLKDISSKFTKASTSDIASTISTVYFFKKSSYPKHNTQKEPKRLSVDNIYSR